MFTSHCGYSKYSTFLLDFGAQASPLCSHSWNASAFLPQQTRRSSKAWLKPKVSIRLHPEDGHSQSRLQNSTDRCFKINPSLRPYLSGWHPSESASLMAVTLKGCYNSVMTYRRQNLWLVMRKTWYYTKSSQQHQRSSKYAGFPTEGKWVGG